MAVLALRRPRDLVYDTLKRRIVMNELTPGCSLTELGLARELGCSQGTVRESLLRLQEDGLVTRGGYRGTTVTRLDAEEACEILAIRRRIEVNSAPRAALNAATADVDRLAAIVIHMRQEAEAGNEFELIELDTAFHLALFGLSGFEALEQVLTRCTLHSHRSKLWAPGRRRPLPAIAARHDVLLERLDARDGPGLAVALGAHIDTIVAAKEDR